MQKIYAKQNIITNKREKVGLNHYDDPKAFIEYSRIQSR